MDKKDYSWLIIIAIILLAMLFGYLDREQEPIKPITNNSSDMIINSSQLKFDAEVEAAGGWENYKRMQKIESCWDACDGYDDPICEICARLGDK